MQHFPIFMAVKGRRIVVSGGTDAAVAKLRLLLKTEARIEVYAPRPSRGRGLGGRRACLKLYRRRSRPWT
jgi:uroporphyrin-III C-methyltransferase/precorrin-2 dehydrogenase/sirohydrochlorin ferrochelatase